MSITDIFSKRKKRLRGEVPDVYQYDDIPNPLRVQILHILGDAHGESARYSGNLIYPIVLEKLCREYGWFQLTDDKVPGLQIANFLLRTESTDEVLDVVELSFQIVDTAVRQQNAFFYDAVLGPDAAIAELNQRFKEHGVGYAFCGGQIIRVDSQLLHAETVKPALVFLAAKGFESANKEFLSAHQHYREGRFEESLNEALKSFESTLKVICEKKKWSYDQKDTAKVLLDTVFSNGLIAPMLQNHLTGLRTTLDGVPTLRNKLSGHGKGVKDHVVPDYVASYALHITAANILMLVSAANE